VAAARDATRKLLGAAPPPSAILCGNDVLAFGVMLECDAQGLGVPRAVSVVGFDDLDLARQWRPALTTVHVPTETMWTLAAEYLLARLDGSLAAPVQREIEVELVVRGSTAKAARGVGRARA
jgi:LacI family transcriptional regulator